MECFIVDVKLRIVSLQSPISLHLTMEKSPAVCLAGIVLKPLPRVLTPYIKVQSSACGVYMAMQLLGSCGGWASAEVSTNHGTSEKQEDKRRSKTARTFCRWIITRSLTNY